MIFICVFLEFQRVKSMSLFIPTYWIQCHTLWTCLRLDSHSFLHSCGLFLTSQPFFLLMNQSILKKISTERINKSIVTYRTYSVQHLLFGTAEDARFMRYILFPYGLCSVVRTICHSKHIKEMRSIKDLSQ